MPNKLFFDEFKPFSYDFGSDIVVVGHNAESADYDNPRGAIHALRPYVRAVDFHGNTRLFYSSKTFHPRDREAEDEAKATAERLTARLAERRMPDFSKWVVGRPVYGSDAYIEYGQADDLAWEKAGHDEPDPPPAPSFRACTRSTVVAT